MSGWIQQAITEIEGKVAAIDEQRAKWVTVLEHLRALAGTPAPTEKSRREKQTKDARPAPARRPSGVRTRPKTAAPATQDAAPEPGSRAAIVGARDASILAALEKGPAPPAGLIHVMPKESGQTADQREAALRNALSRIQAKKRIKSTEDGWTLA